MDNTEETRFFKPPFPLILRIEQGLSAGVEKRFTDDFQIGRDPACQFVMKDRPVSRFHLKFFYDGENWWLKDLNSTNGTFLEGKRIGKIVLPLEAKIALGDGGPLLSIIQDKPQVPIVSSSKKKKTRPESMTQVMSHYFSKSDQSAGEHTMMVRQAFKEAKKKHSKRYLSVIVLIVMLLAGLGGFSWFQQQRLKSLEGIAEDIFYTMKSIEVQMAQVESSILSVANPAQKEVILKKRVEFKRMSERYNHYVADLGIYDDKEISKEEKVIMRVRGLVGSGLVFCLFVLYLSHVSSSSNRIFWSVLPCHFTRRWA